MSGCIAFWNSIETSGRRYLLIAGTSALVKAARHKSIDASYARVVAFFKELFIVNVQGSCIMNTPIRFTLQALGASLSLFAAVQAHSAPQVNSDYKTYQCVVLGQDSDCKTNVANPDVTHLVPGPYAQYLIENGTSQPEALAAAKLAGEDATWHFASSVPKARLSDLQTYQREMGIVSPTPAEGAARVSRAK